MLKDTLDNFGDKVVHDAKRNLNIDKSNYTKDLYNGIKYKTKSTNKGYVLEFTMPFHGAVLDEGISGTKKKRQTRFSYKESSGLLSGYALGKWAKAKGLKPRSKSGQFTKVTASTFNSIGFAIAKKIKREGKKGTQFFTRSFDKQFDLLPEEALKGFSLDLDIILKKNL